MKLLRHIFLFYLLVFNCFPLFPQAVQNKINSLTVDSLPVTGEKKLNKEETANFSPTQIDDILKKINYKKNQIVIPTHNPVAKSKGNEKTNPFNEPEIKKTVTKQVPKETANQKLVTGNQKQVTPNQQPTTNKLIAETTPNLTIVPSKEKNKILQDSLKKDSVMLSQAQIEKPKVDVAPVSEVKPDEPVKTASKPDSVTTEPVAYVNPFKSEESEQKTLTEDEQIEKTYSELLVRKQNNSILMAKQQDDLTELPPLDASSWKKSTKITVQQAEKEITMYKSRINRLLANYYPGKDQMDDSHSFMRNHNLDSLNKELVKSYYLLGLAYFNTLDLQQSAETFKKVTQLYHDLDKSYSNISLIYETNKNFGEEIKKLKSSFFTNERKRD